MSAEQPTLTEEQSVPQEPSDSFQALLDSLEIPPNIDPRLLALWIERERDEWEKNHRSPRMRKTGKTRSLGVLFAAFVGIMAMCLTILLGIVRETETQEILITASEVFLAYTLLGFVLGLIAEYCVAESVETLLRDIIRRSHEAEQAQVSS
jgi:hypothetical protein